jgi:hypothetical protein
LFDRSNKASRKADIEVPKLFEERIGCTAKIKKDKQFMSVDWLIRKAKYQGYITFDKDTGKTGFLLTIPIN